MFGKVQEDSFQSIFDLSFDGDESSVVSAASKCAIGSTRSKNNSGSNGVLGKVDINSSVSSPALLKIKSLGGLHLDLDEQSSCWRTDNGLFSPQEDLFSNDDDAFFFSVDNKKGSKASKKLGGILMTSSNHANSNSSASSTCSNSSLSGNNNNNNNNKVNTSRYKTELCRAFQENGSCKYGEKCQFAHGTQELRSVLRHPKYKTDLCRTYHSVGFCPYGPRCHFIHSLDEVPPVQPAHNNKPIPSTVSSPALSKDYLLQSAPTATPAATPVATPAPVVTPASAAVTIKPLPMFSSSERSQETSGFIFGVQSSPDLNSLGLVGLGSSSSSSSSSGVSSAGSLSPSIQSDFEDLKISRLPVFSSLIK